MEKTGLTTEILEAVSDIADGRIGFRTKDKTEEGRENFTKGLKLGKKIFSEMKNLGASPEVSSLDRKFIVLAGVHTPIRRWFITCSVV
jgi:hypothetical protein